MSAQKSNANTVGFFLRHIEYDKINVICTRYANRQTNTLFCDCMWSFEWERIWTGF